MDYVVEQFAEAFMVVGCAIELAAGKSIPGSYSVGSDTYACTVAHATAGGGRLTVVEDRPLGGALYEQSDEKRYFTLRGDGRYRQVGRTHGALQVGRRKHYMDPSF